MSRSVTFNGITKFRPGGITRINAEALNQVGISANNIIGLIGESTEGEPGSSSGLVTLNDPSRATELFGSGPLVDAIRAAFQSSGDPLIPGGASEVVVYKTNATTQATVDLVSDSLSFQAISNTATGGSGTTLVDTAIETSLGGDTFTGDFVGCYLYVRPGLATGEVRPITAYDGTTFTFTVSPAFTSAVVATDQYLIVDNVSPLVAAVDTAATTTTIPIKSVTLTVDELAGRTVFLSDTSAFSAKRVVVSNTATTLTLSAALPSAPTEGTLIAVLTDSLDLSASTWGTAGNLSSIELDMNGEAYAMRGVTPVLDYSYVVTSSSATDSTSDSFSPSGMFSVLYTGGAVLVTDTVASAGVFDLVLVAGGLVVNAQKGRQVRVSVGGEFEYSSILSNSIDTLDLSVPFSAPPDAGTTVEILDVVAYAPFGVSASSCSVTGAGGRATAFKTKVIKTTSTTVVHPDNLNITITSSDTLATLAAKIEANTNYVVFIHPSVSPETLASTLDYSNGQAVSAPGCAYISVSGNMLLAHPSTYHSYWVTAERTAFLNYFNNENPYFDATLATSAATARGYTFDGGIPPVYFANYAYGGIELLASYNLPSASTYVASGGSRGISSNASFQAGFDKMLTRVVNYVSPLVDADLSGEGFGSTATWASVSAQLVDHVSAARGAAGLERGGFIGFTGTKADIIAAANSMNDMDIQLTCQNPTVLDAAGTLTEMSPRIMAVMAASMRAGVQEIGEPLTHKYLRTSSVTQDSGWDPRDTTDATDLIKAGVLFSETVPGQGIRWVRDLTTWVKNDNLAYAEGSVRDVVRYVAYGLRTGVEDRFTGRKALPATIAAVKDFVSTLLEEYRQNNIIVDSTDPLTGTTIKAYHNLKVFSTGDILKINVGIFPVPGINFQLTDIYLQLPTQSA